MNTAGVSCTTSDVEGMVSRPVLLIDTNIRMSKEEGDYFVIAIPTSPNECSHVVEIRIGGVDVEIRVLIQIFLISSTFPLSAALKNSSAIPHSILRLPLRRRRRKKEKQRVSKVLFFFFFPPKFLRSGFHVRSSRQEIYELLTILTGVAK